MKNSTTWAQLHISQNYYWCEEKKIFRLQQKCHTYDTKIIEKGGCVFYHKKSNQITDLEKIYWINLTQLKK